MLTIFYILCYYGNAPSFKVERRAVLYERPVKVITTLCFVFNYKTDGKVVKKD